MNKLLICKVLWVFASLLTVSCQSTPDNIETVKKFLAARQSKDEVALAKLVSPGMRIWYEEKKGEGRLWSPKSAWANWDDFFRGTKTFSDFKRDSNAVTVEATETNDFFQLIERPPSQVQLTWWLDPAGKISGYLVKSISGNAVPDRLEEFGQWAGKTDPAELEYLMPGGKINPEGDRPERWKKMLLRWRETLGKAKPLEITFIGNEAFEITDGTVTLLSDFPYLSGAFGYMTYDMAAVQPPGKVLCLITHEHDDHFSPRLWAEKNWHLLASPRIKTPDNQQLRLPFADTVVFEDIRIFAQKTPHTDAHFSYLVEWHGKQFYFPGDTDVLDFFPKNRVDVLFITPWLLEKAQKRKMTLNAEKVVVYHHRSDDAVACSGCVVPKRGDKFLLE